MPKTREEIKSIVYEVSDGLKIIADKYANGEYEDTKDFVPIAEKFRSVINYFLNPHLDPKDVII